MEKFTTNEDVEAFLLILDFDSLNTHSLRSTRLKRRFLQISPKRTNYG